MDVLKISLVGFFVPQNIQKKSKDFRKSMKISVKILKLLEKKTILFFKPKILTGCSLKYLKTPLLVLLRIVLLKPILSVCVQGGQFMSICLLI